MAIIRAVVVRLPPAPNVSSHRDVLNLAQGSREG
jgi:hypothetical protein